MNIKNPDLSSIMDIINAVLMRRSKNTFPCVTNIEDICQCYEKPQEIYAT